MRVRLRAPAGEQAANRRRSASRAVAGQFASVVPLRAFLRVITVAPPRAVMADGTSHIRY